MAQWKLRIPFLGSLDIVPNVDWEKEREKIMRKNRNPVTSGKDQNVDSLYIASVLVNEGVKTRHKMKMMMLDIILFVGIIFLGTEAYKGAITFSLTLYPMVSGYIIATGVATILLGLAYLKSYLDEKDCKVCQER